MVSNDDFAVLLAPLPISIKNNESPTPRDPTSPQCPPRTYALLCIRHVICYASQTSSPLGAEHAERSLSLLLNVSVTSRLLASDPTEEAHCLTGP